jgi:hypothetical protein
MLPSWQHAAGRAVDARRRFGHDSFEMATVLGTDKARRSSRVFARIRVRVQGKNDQGRKFREPGETIVISAHGGLLYLNESPVMGADVVLVNPLTEEEQECRVVYLGETGEKGQRIGVEFLYPAPHFWGVEFAPPDWPSSPATTDPAPDSLA